MTTATVLQPDTAPDARPYHERYKHQPHWRNNEDEFEGAKIGMWLFLATELLLFSGFFCAYAVLRMWHPEAFRGAAEHYLDWRIGAINTAILLVSSFTVAWGVRCAQLGKKWGIVANYTFSALCGVAFLALKLLLEYFPKIQKGELPAGLFHYPHGEDAYEPIFLSVYWVATATHGLHVLIGVFLLLWIAWGAVRDRYGPNHYTAVENVGLYWHLVDLIWIFLFPLLYLVP